MLAILLLAMAFAGSMREQAAGWLPAPAEEFLVKQLVERLGQISLGWSHERTTNAAQAAIASMRSRLSLLSEAQLASRAPSLEALNLPPAGDQRLDVMARYQMCVTLYYVRHDRRAKEDSEENKIGAVMGLSAGSLVMLHLRHAFIAAGGTDEQMEKFLSGSTLEPAVERMQRDPALMAAVQAECAPVFRALIQG